MGAQASSVQLSQRQRKRINRARAKEANLGGSSNILHMDAGLNSSSLEKRDKSSENCWWAVDGTFSLDCEKSVKSVLSHDVVGVFGSLDPERSLSLDTEKRVEIHEIAEPCEANISEAAYSANRPGKHGDGQASRRSPSKVFSLELEDAPPCIRDVSYGPGNVSVTAQAQTRTFGESSGMDLGGSTCSDACCESERASARVDLSISLPPGSASVCARSGRASASSQESELSESESESEPRHSQSMQQVTLALNTVTGALKNMG